MSATEERATIRRLDASTVDDFRTLLSQPPEGWCWCVAWEVPSWEGWGERTAQENRALREKLWQQGSYHGYVFYLDGAPAGWCRAGPTAAWPKLCATREVEAREDVYALTCFGMRPEHRRRGRLRAFLAQVLDDLAARGVAEVVAFPKAIDGEAPDGKLWNGPTSLFLRAGFRVVREGAGWRELRLRLGDERR